MIKVLMVCMGNICRSPTAEAVMRTAIKRAGLGNQVVVDSAGTHNYHQGEAPDKRARIAAKKRGYDLTAITARQVNQQDFEIFDFILAMDRHNLALLQKQCSTEHLYKLSLLLSHTKTSENPESRILEVPDPYYGGDEGFVRVINLIESASDGLLRTITSRLDSV
jgi:protein-tyrosine phosphatase